MKKLSKMLVTIAAAIALFGAATSAQATKIEYTQSGNTLNFTVINDGNLAISGFDVFFGTASYNGVFTPPDNSTGAFNFSNAGAFGSLSGNTAPSGWDSYLFPPTAVDNPWTYDAITSGAPIANGQSLGGFSTSYTLTSTASVDHLGFYVYDANFGTLDYGYTELHIDNPGGNPVPEPSTMLLLGAGLSGLLLYRRKRA